MTQDNLLLFLEEMQAAFLEDRLYETSDRFCLPLVVYSVAGVTVLWTISEIVATSRLYRDAVFAMSVVSSSIEIISRDPALNNRQRATVRVWDYNAEGRAVTGSLIRYFLIQENGNYKIEMMEYLEAPLPPKDVERIVH